MTVPAVLWARALVVFEVVDLLVELVPRFEAAPVFVPRDDALVFDEVRFARVAGSSVFGAR